MNLKSEMRPDGFGNLSLFWKPSDLSHDALAAHALLQAMDEYFPVSLTIIQDRADELMREWTGR